MNSTITLYDARTLRVPVYGQIGAGRPLDEAPVIGWRTIRVPRDYRKGQRLCAVIVNGESLRDAAILTGDLIICRMQPRLDYQGQLAAVLTPDGLTLKYTYAERGRVRLEAGNRAYPPLWYAADEVGVQGVVIRIERDL